MKYHNHENIEIRLQTDGLIGIEDLNKYDGVYENESVSLQHKLIIYNEIIPNLLEYYRNDIQNKNGSTEIELILQMKNKI